MRCQDLVNWSGWGFNDMVHPFSLWSISGLNWPLVVMHSGYEFHGSWTKSPDPRSFPTRDDGNGRRWRLGLHGLHYTVTLGLCTLSIYLLHKGHSPCENYSIQPLCLSLEVWICEYLIVTFHGVNSQNIWTETSCTWTQFDVISLHTELQSLGLQPKLCSCGGFQLKFVTRLTC